MNMVKDFLFALFRGFLESIDIVSKQRGVHTYPTGKFCHIYFFVGEEETLQATRFGILIFKTFKADILIQIPPMNAIATKRILASFFIISLSQLGIPQQRLNKFPLLWAGLGISQPRG